MTKTKKYNDEVIYSADPITKVDSEFIEQLKSMAAASSRKRMRLCCHNDIDNVLHEMLIVHAKGAYIPPHKHVHKTESFHMIEGELQIVVFSEEGNVSEIIDMGEYKSGRKFYYRLTENFFHMVIPLSDFVVFHETTNGPFVRADMICAPWAPRENDPEGQKIYLSELDKKLRFFKPLLCKAK